jgi:hypothetical protein
MAAADGVRPPPRQERTARCQERVADGVTRARDGVAATQAAEGVVAARASERGTAASWPGRAQRGVVECGVVVARKVFVKMSVLGIGHGWESFPPNTKKSADAPTPKRLKKCFHREGAGHAGDPFLCLPGSLPLLALDSLADTHSTID